MADVDIATLGIKVDASSADTAKGQLDGLTVSAEKTEAATRSAGAGTDAMRAAIMAAVNAITTNTGALSNLTNSVTNYGGATRGAGAATDSLDNQVSKLRSSCDPLAGAIDRVNQELAQNNALLQAGAIDAAEHARNQTVLMGRMNDFQSRQSNMNALHVGGARSAKLQSHEMLNLSRQFADIGVTAAMGMNPLMILIQQGPQIADVFQTASARGIGFKTVLLQIGAAAAPILAILAPLIILVGTLAMAMKGLKDNAADDAHMKRYAASLGLTKDEMKKLEDVTVTWGDTAMGVWDTVLDRFGTNTAEISKTWEDAMSWAGQIALGFVQAVVGVFTFLLVTTLSVFKNIGVGIIKAIEFGVNGAIGLIETLVNKVASMSRTTAGFFSAITGKKIEGFADVKFDRAKADVEFSNPITDGANAAAGAANATGRFFKDSSGAATRRAQKRVKKQADEIIDDRNDPSAKKARVSKPKVSDETKDWERELKSAQEFTKAMNEQTEEIGKTIYQTKMLATERKSAELLAAADATGSSANRLKAIEEIKLMRKATEEWIMATNAEKIKDMRYELKQESDQIAFERTLLSMNSEERLKAIKLREINLKIMAAEKDGYLGVAAALREEAEALGNEAGKTGAMEDKIKAANDATEAMRQMNDGIRDATASFGELFGTAGEGFANLLGVVLDYNEQTAESNNRLAEIQGKYRENEQMSQADAEETARIRAGMAQQQVAHYGDMLHAAKGFFKEGTTGYKILEGAERVYRLFQFAMAIRAMFMDKAQTVSSVANSGMRAAADGVAAVAKAIASLPFPLNIVAGAATLAFLVGIGVKMFGGGGSKGGGGGASKEAEKQTEQYKGPRDEYGAPTSYYSVLRPGQTTVAGSGGYNGYGGAPAAAAGGVSVKGGDFNLTIQGGADKRTIQEQLVPMLDQYRQATVQDARQAVAKDQSSNRQQIGGGWG